MRNKPHISFAVTSIVGSLLCIAAVCYTTIQFGWIAGIVASLMPLILFWIFSILKNPKAAMYSILILSFVIPSVVKYYYDFPGGVIMDIMLILTLSSLLICNCTKFVGWYRSINGLTVCGIIWFVYCLLEMFNTNILSMGIWWRYIRPYSLYSLLIVIFVPAIFNRFKDLKIVLNIWAILTLAAFVKVLLQKFYGFSDAELEWLFARGGYTTHIIWSGVRYFSFFSDAANFGTNMALSMTTFLILVFYTKKWSMKLFYFIVAGCALTGLLLSGTRSALIVPIAGMVLFVLLSKDWRVSVIGLASIAVVVFFFKFTMIGQGYSVIRRVRSAFTPSKDMSYLVRKKNQAILRTYMADKPFGVGLGYGGVKAKEYAPNAFASQVPTDSEYVMIWVETGVVGLAIYLLISLYILFYGVWIVFSKLKTPRVRGYTMALVCGVAGFMINLAYNEVLQFPNNILLYMMQGFIFMAPYYDKQVMAKHMPVKNDIDNNN